MLFYVYYCNLIVDDFIIYRNVEQVQILIFFNYDCN